MTYSAIIQPSDNTELMKVIGNTATSQQHSLIGKET